IPHPAAAAVPVTEVTEEEPVTAVEAESTIEPEPTVETVENAAKSPDIELPEGEQTRINDSVEEHKHEGYDYWHPSSRIHKTKGDEE
ncbi:MAG: hypothetical protein HF970_09370, partial [ANME-2 cluster archaeon]|nr:hypothetical protein [ANME-2 cluster archaeon]